MKQIQKKVIRHPLVEVDRVVLLLVWSLWRGLTVIMFQITYCGIRGYGGGSVVRHTNLQQHSQCTTGSSS